VHKGPAQDTQASHRESPNLGSATLNIGFILFSSFWALKRVFGRVPSLTKYPIPTALYKDPKLPIWLLKANPDRFNQGCELGHSRRPSVIRVGGGDQGPPGARSV
jgi:hypothetical protein